VPKIAPNLKLLATLIDGKLLLPRDEPAGLIKNLLGETPCGVSTAFTFLIYRLEIGDGCRRRPVGAVVRTFQCE
jgi:hypothetical protein